MSEQQQPFEHELADWLSEGPTAGPPGALATTLARTRHVRRRPGILARTPGGWFHRGTGGRIGRVAVPIPLAILLVLLSLLMAVVGLAVGSSWQRPTKLAILPEPSASVAPKPSPVPASTSPRPVSTPTTFRSEALGFEADQPLDTPPWNNFLYGAGGPRPDVLTFPDGQHLGGDVWSSFIVVSVGTAADGALVDPPVADSAASPPAGAPGIQRIWGSTLDELAARYIESQGGALVAKPTLLGGEAAVQISGGGGRVDAVVARHGDRAFVLLARAFLGGFGAPGFDAFVASFRFVEAAVVAPSPAASPSASSPPAPSALVVDPSLGLGAFIVTYLPPSTIFGPNVHADVYDLGSTIRLAPGLDRYSVAIPDVVISGASLEELRASIEAGPIGVDGPGSDLRIGGEAAVRYGVNQAFLNPLVAVAVVVHDDRVYVLTERMAFEGGVNLSEFDRFLRGLTFR